jgi:hypothetical protein
MRERHLAQLYQLTRIGRVFARLTPIEWLLSHLVPAYALLAVKGG